MRYVSGPHYGIRHKHFIAALRRFGSPEHFVDAVDNLYTAASTVFILTQGKRVVPDDPGCKAGRPSVNTVVQYSD